MSQPHPDPDDRPDDAEPDDDAATGADPGARPVVRLRPKAGRRFLSGAPWVYADEVVMDRRTRRIPAGTVVELQDSDRRPLCAAAFNAASGIALRRLDADPAAEVDADWLAARLRAAADLRARLGLGDVHRLVHAEADDLPGLIVDRFGDAVAVQPNAAWADARIEAIADALVETVGVSTVVLSGASRARAQEGLAEETRVLRGALDGPLDVAMNGATYRADLLGGQKTGLFLDQRPNHAFAAPLAGGGRVLDVFCHVGGFALSALAAGAASAIGVDGSRPALALAEEGAARSGLADRFEARRDDGFDAMKALGEAGEVFDLVVCDPPAFAPARSAVENGLRAYRRLARLAAPLVAPGGFLVLCSCSGAVSPDAFLGACADGLRAGRREARLIRVSGAGPDHPVHPALPETDYLKCTVWRLA